jgi:hypothetical protein
MAGALRISDGARAARSPTALGDVLPAGIRKATVLLHYDLVDWLGLSFRYGFFNDQEGGRTGVDQQLQSWTFAPIVHLTRLIPDLRPTGATYARSRHAIDWVDLKIEYRINRSNESVFSDAKPGEDILEADQLSHQVQLQLIANF